jgi:uncharacterized repeat protein (TIGR03803 family)
VRWHNSRCGSARYFLLGRRYDISVADRSFQTFPCENSGTGISFSALLLIAAHPAQAQTLTVLYNFTGAPDGDNPDASLVFDNAGNIYGTTTYGGNICSADPYGCGTVFKLSANGSGGWNETVVYAFTGGADGASHRVT